MDYYPGIAVSLECSSVCVVDGSGKIVREGKVVSEPAALIAWLASTDRSGRISKIRDAAVREALYQAAHVMLTKPVKSCTELKSWGMRIGKRAGMRKAKVALARKLAVVMHRMLADGQVFNPDAKAARIKTIAAAA